MGPSPIAVRGEKAFTYEGEKDFSPPKKLTHADINDLIADYVQAAENAIGAGAPTVATSGLLEQGVGHLSNLSNEEDYQMASFYC